LWKVWYGLVEENDLRAQHCFVGIVVVVVVVVIPTYKTGQWWL